MDSEVDYLALCINNDNFFVLELIQWELYIRMESYTFCKGDQLIHRRTGSSLCEISRLSNPQNILGDCKMKLVTLDTLIWNRLSKTNSWLYYTKPYTCTITCSDPPQTLRVEIAGMGRLIISLSCEIYTKNSILKPINKNIRNVQADVIPDNPKFNVISMLKTLYHYYYTRTFQI